MLHKLLLFTFINLACAYSVFPAGSCAPQNCQVNNPYVLLPVESAPGTICFSVDRKTCDSTTPCCNSLVNVLEKIAIKVNPICDRSNVKKVTIDGILKGGGVYLDAYTGFSELRITSLGMNADSGVGRVFCVELQGVCGNVKDFCGNTTCTYAVYDPFTHKCCPTCTMQQYPSSPSMYPTSTPPLSPSMNPLNPVRSPSTPPLSPTFTPSSPVKSPSTPPLSPIVAPLGPVKSPSTPPLSPNMTPLDPVKSPLGPPLSPSSPVKFPLAPPLSPPASNYNYSVSIKSPTQSPSYVLTSLCPSFNSYLNTRTCRIQLISTTGIYYGGGIPDDIVIPLRSDLQQNLQNFTLKNNIPCGSTVTVFKGKDDILRYKVAQPPSCMQKNEKPLKI